MKTNYMYVYVIYVRVQVEEFERFGSLKFYVGIFLSIRIPLFVEIKDSPRRIYVLFKIN